MTRAGLPAMDVAARTDRVRAALDAVGAPALLVTNLTNVRYLTGFTGSAALLLVTADGLTFVTDGRYGEQAAQQLADAGVEAAIEVTNAAQRTVLAGAVAEAGLASLALEADSVTWAAQRTYAEEWFPGIELVPTSGVVAGVRVVKDDGEVARIEAAAAIADAALAEVRPMLADGPTERAFGRALDAAMLARGADDLSFETIVASGPNGARPHHRPGDRQIHEGDLVVLDFGALVDGYHSDMTRTVAVGAISGTQQRMLDVVLAAQAAGVEAVTAGVPARDVDAVCRRIIAEAGWEQAFLHGTGHGVGLDIHEDPRVGKTSAATLVDRCVVTVEPGVYLPEHGGVRIEDTVVVTAQGARRLTSSPRDPAI